MASAEPPSASAPSGALTFTGTAALMRADSLAAALVPAEPEPLPQEEELLALLGDGEYALIPDPQLRDDIVRELRIAQAELRAAGETKRGGLARSSSAARARVAHLRAGDLRVAMGLAGATGAPPPRLPAVPEPPVR